MPGSELQEEPTARPGLGKGQRVIWSPWRGLCWGLPQHQGPPSWSCCCMPGLLHLLPDLVTPCVLLLMYLSRGLLRARRTIPTTCCVKRGNSPPFKKLQCFLVEVWLIYNVNSRCAAKSVSCIYMHIYIFFFLYHFPLWFITEY